MRLSIETIFVGLTIFLLIYLSQRDNSDNINETVDKTFDERVVIMPGYINPYYRNPYYRRYPHYYPHISHRRGPFHRTIHHRHGPHRRGPGPRPRHHRHGPHRGRNIKSNIETPVTETPDTETPATETQNL